MFANLRWGVLTGWGDFDGWGVGGDLQDACQTKKHTLAGLEINATDAVAVAVAEERLAGAGKDSRRGNVARDTVVPTQSSTSTSVQIRTTVPLVFG